MTSRLVIQAANLSSRVVRRQVTSNTGVRRINLGPTQSGGFLSGFKRFLDFGLGLIKTALAAIGTVGDWVRALFTGFGELVRFNWNETDADIEQQIKGNNLSIAEQWGETLGNTVCIAGVLGATYLIPNIGPAIAAAAAGKLTPEIIDDFSDSFRMTLQLTAKNMGMGIYKNIRSFLKSIPIPDGIPFADKLRQIQAAWGNGKPWTIYGAIEEKIESVPHEGLRAFLEGALEGCFEGIQKAGYVVAEEVDTWIALSRSAARGTMGSNRGVVINLDAGNPQGQRIRLQGPQRLLAPQIFASLAGHQLTYGKDVGVAVVNPGGEYVRGNRQLRTLTIEYRIRERPPWKTAENAGEKFIKPTYSIPDLKSSISWQELKLAVGGTSGYYWWGGWRATANLDNGRQMAVYGRSGPEAEDKLEEFLRLSNAKILTLSITEEKERHIRLKKRPTQVFPAYAIYRKIIERGDGTYTGIDGVSYDETTVSIKLWLDEPAGVFPLL